MFVLKQIVCHNGSKYFEYVNENKGLRLNLSCPMSIFYSKNLESNLYHFKNKNGNK